MAIADKVEFKKEIAEISPDAFVGVRTDMLNLGDGTPQIGVQDSQAVGAPPANKSKKHVRIEEVDPEGKPAELDKFAILKVEFTDACKTTSSLYERLQKELKSTDKVIARLRLKKGWGEVASDQIRQETDKLLEKNKSFHADFVVAPMLHSDGASKVEESIAAASKDWVTALTKACTSHETEYKTYVRLTLGDFVKFRN